MRARGRVWWVFLLVLAMVASACGGGAGSQQGKATAPQTGGGSTVAPAAANTDGTLSIAVRNWDYDTFDPHVSNFHQSHYVFMNIFDPLLWLGPDMKIYPGLATEYTSENDARSWVLKLRKDVAFHDGSKFNAEVAKFNFDRMAAPATKSKMAVQLLGPYVGTDIIDEYTVRVKFDKPFTLFPYNLTTHFMSMVSMEAVKKHGNEFAKHLIGSGPMKFVKEVPKVETVLERNPNYNWGPSFAKHQGPVRFKNLVFKFVQEDEPRLTTLKTNATQIIDEVPTAAVKDLKASKDYLVFTPPRYGIARSYHFNVDLAPTNDIAIRKAMVHAIDRDLLAKTVMNEVYPVAYTVMVPGTKYYDKSLEAQVKYDPALAKKILDDAGWKPGPGGIREKNGVKATLILATFPGFVAEAPSEYAQAQLKEVGIDMQIKVMDGTAMMSGIAQKASTFNVALIGSYDPDPTSLLYRFYHSKNAGTGLYSHFTTPELDSLLDLAAGTTDEAKKAAALQKVQKIAVENALGVGLYANAAVFAARSNIKNLIFDPRAFPWVYDVEIGG